MTMLLSQSHLAISFQPAEWVTLIPSSPSLAFSPFRLVAYSPTRLFAFSLSRPFVPSFDAD